MSPIGWFGGYAVGTRTRVCRHYEWPQQGDTSAIRYTDTLVQLSPACTREPARHDESNCFSNLARHRLYERNTSLLAACGRNDVIHTQVLNHLAIVIKWVCYRHYAEPQPSRHYVENRMLQR
jgi:hypothetical protein